MQIWKNKKSGEYFIYIESAGKGKAHLVLPGGKAAKPLELIFFDQPEKGNEKDFLSRGLITNRQIKRYKEEVNQRAKIDELHRKEAAKQAFEDLPQKEIIKRVKLWEQEFNKMPPEKQKIFLEKLELELTIG